MNNLFKKIKSSPSLFFVFIATIFGFFFLLLIPPFQTPDEYIHFYRAYETSELKLPKYEEKYKAAGNFLPKSIKETEEALRAGPEQIRFNPREKYSQRLTKHALLDVPLDRNDRVFYDTLSSGPQYMPLMYSPHALVIAVARLFDSPVVAMVYLVRILNLLLWVTIGFFAIRIIPWKKWALVTVLLIPIMVSQSISMGLDVLVYGSAFLFIVTIFNLISDRKKIINKKEAGLLIATALLMVFGKVTFVALLPLILLLKTHQTPRYSWLFKLLVLMLPIILYGVWSLLTAGVNPAVQTSSSSLQVHSILSNPLIFPIELISTFFFVWGDSITQSLIGNFGWLDTPLSAPFVCFGVFLLIFAMLVNYEGKKAPLFSKSQKIITYTFAFIYFCSVALAMYIYSTENSLRFITGIQGRYFIPLLVLLIPVLCMQRLKIDQETFIKFVQYSTILLLLISSITILFRYYIVYYPMQ